MQQEEEAYAEQGRARVEKQFPQHAKELGCEVKKIEPPPGGEPAAGV